MGKVVGIDLGTTNSVVAVMEGGKPIVIANAEGMRTTPSVVAFTKDGERLVGQMARRQSVLNPQNTFYGIKRFMGRKYTELSNESKRVPYTIRRDEANGGIQIKCPRLQKDFSPEELSAMVLKKLTEEAARYLGESISAAVITVPAYFNDSQRQATRDAGRIAGLDVLRILNEPTAASLAYGLDRREQETIFVFDLGGGTFDVSILDIGDGVFEVKATSGDTQLGGNDFDKRIVDWLADQFQAREGVDLRRDRQALQRLMEAAEKAKIELSGVTSTLINLPFIAAGPEGPLHLETELTRRQFEELCVDLVNRMRQPVKQALNDARLSPDRIDEVVLVGGASRMPMVRQLVRSLIDLEPNENVNPDEVVAIGAAIQAGILNQEVKDILLLDVTPLSVGLETVGGMMKKLIPRNTTIPVRRSDVFSTSENNQTMVEVHIVQGEREMAVDNKSLGRFKLMGIPPAPRGIPQITVSFDVDANGILQVTALDRTTGREQGITIQGTSNLSDAEIDQMIKEAELYADEDRQKRDRIEKRTQAEALTFEAERQLREVALDFGMQFASSYRRRIENLIKDLRDALKQNNDRYIDTTQADLRDALYELQREVYQITKEDEEDTDFFGSIRRTLSNLGEEFFGDDDDFYDDRRDNYNRDSYGRDNYSRDSYGRDSYNRDSSNRDSYNRDSYGRDSYNRDSYGQSSYGNDYGRNSYSQNYGAEDRRENRDPYVRPDPYARSERDAYGSRDVDYNASRSDYGNRQDGNRDNNRESGSLEYNPPGRLDDRERPRTERPPDNRNEERKEGRSETQNENRNENRNITWDDNQPTPRRGGPRTEDTAGTQRGNRPDDREPPVRSSRDAWKQRDLYGRENREPAADRDPYAQPYPQEDARDNNRRSPRENSQNRRPPAREQSTRDPYRLPDDEWGDEDEWL